MSARALTESQGDSLAGSDDAAVAIIGGTGALGYGLVLRLAAGGVNVSIGSRDAGRAQSAAVKLEHVLGDGSAGGATATIGHGVNAEVAGAAGIVIVTVPFAAQLRTIMEIKEALRPGQILVDATVPLETAFGGRPTHTLGVWAGSAAAQAQRAVPDGVHVVSAFHTVSAVTLSDPEAELREDVLVCGDRREDKQRVCALVERIPGLRAVDVGRLEMSRIVEQLTALMISINIRHKTHAGIQITGLKHAEKTR